MLTRLTPFAALLVVVLTMTACSQTSTGNDTTTTAAISGRIEDGLRVLTFDGAKDRQDFRIYRGDYVRPELVGGAPFTLEIADLEVSHQVPAPEGQRPYFKVPEAGTYAYRIGDLHGVIEAVDYTDTRYQEVTAKDAAALIENIDPFILDVRTQREFNTGHLQDATLIPVQVLKGRIGSIAAHKDQPVFVYCRTGNRSTVAAKILIDAGFERVINLRRGIVEWQRAGLPVVR